MNSRFARQPEQVVPQLGSAGYRDWMLRVSPHSSVARDLYAVQSTWRCPVW